MSRAEVNLQVDYLNLPTPPAAFAEGRVREVNNAAIAWKDDHGYAGQLGKNQLQRLTEMKLFDTRRGAIFNGGD